LQPEADMVQRFQVSRGSLREALRILEVHGLIVIKSGPRGGPRVVNIGPSEFGHTATFFYQVTRATFHELAEVRLFVEPSATRLAATRRPLQSLDEIERFIKEAKALDTNDDRGHIRMSRQFHSLIASLAGNKVLELISGSFEEIYSLYAVNTLSPTEKRNVVRAHEKIAKAVILGDADAAERHMRTHLAASNRDFESRYPTLVDQPVHWI
jgi:GntR family transcriptional regulator, transcriptional repressor for pyruvate dehydrogenase complex